MWVEMNETMRTRVLCDLHGSGLMNENWSLGQQYCWLEEMILLEILCNSQGWVWSHHGLPPPCSIQCQSRNSSQDTHTNNEKKIFNKLTKLFGSHIIHKEAKVTTPTLYMSILMLITCRDYHNHKKLLVMGRILVVPNNEEGSSITICLILHKRNEGEQVSGEYSRKAVIQPWLITVGGPSSLERW